MKKMLSVILMIAVLFTLVACNSTQAAEASVAASSSAMENVTGPGETLQTERTEGTDDRTQEETIMKMNVQVGSSTFTATLESNEAVDELKKMMENGPVTISMSDYSGFEKVGALGTNLPTSNSQTTTHAGDIVLYNGNQIVIFYGSNSWSYTRLGKIDDLSGWETALGSGNVDVTFSLD
ncbi:MAG: hypothetical protein LIO81_12170 [Clostridiales bacterium]|nr:hypothetical protein [Clostridiales bacterium]